MADKKKKVNRRPPAKTPQEREEQLISVAIDLAEEQILSGTASSQVITHFLKLASSKERLDQEIKMKEKELLEVKTETMKSQQRVEELYDKALKAMKTYSGAAPEDIEYEEE